MPFSFSTSRSPIMLPTTFNAIYSSEAATSVLQRIQILHGPWEYDHKFSHCITWSEQLRLLLPVIHQHPWMLVMLRGEKSECPMLFRNLAIFTRLSECYIYVNIKSSDTFKVEYQLLS